MNVAWMAVVTVARRRPELLPRVTGLDTPEGAPPTPTGPEPARSGSPPGCELLDAEKELTRRSDELARQRQELPWVPIEQDYRFETEDGTASLADLFGGRSQLLIYHFMFGPDYTAGCPACSAIADGFDGSVVHLAAPRRRADAPCRARRIAAIRPTSAGWGGGSRGRPRSAATSTTTSSVVDHRGAAARGSRRVQLPARRRRCPRRGRAATRSSPRSRPWSGPTSRRTPARRRG